MPKLTLPLVFAGLLLSSSIAMAQEGNYIGGGEGGDMTAEITHIDGDVYGISLSTGFPISGGGGGCGGGIDGEVILDATGGNFFVENEDYEPGSTSPMLGEQYCEIKLSFDEDGILSVEEQSGCLVYHGAACEFTGELVLDSAVN